MPVFVHCGCEAFPLVRGHLNEIGDELPENYIGFITRHHVLTIFWGKWNSVKGITIFSDG